MGKSNGVTRFSEDYVLYIGKYQRNAGMMLDDREYVSFITSIE
jgi:hypothetical protein